MLLFSLSWLSCCQFLFDFYASFSCKRERRLMLSSTVCWKSLIFWRSRELCNKRRENNAKREIFYETSTVRATGKDFIKFTDRESSFALRYLIFFIEFKGLKNRTNFLNNEGVMFPNNTLITVDRTRIQLLS